MTHGRVTLKDVCSYITLESFIGRIPHAHMSDVFLADSVDTTFASLLIVQNLRYSVNCRMS